MKFLWDNSTLDESDYAPLFDRTNHYLEHLKIVRENNSYEDAEASINLSFDEQILDEVVALKEKLVTPSLKYIIDIGIGGSNLGTKAVYDAIFGYFDILEPNRFPKIIFTDTNDPEFLEKLVQLVGNLSEDEILINAISKSGETTETVANLEIIFESFKFKDKLVITTDENSKLWDLAKSLGVEVLAIPKSVGGRFSVLSNVGLFALSLAGVDLEKLRGGARDILQKCLEGDLMSNPAFLSAAALFLLSKKGFVINDNFFFHPELESLGKWYRQLMGESIGKEKDLEGHTVNAGITPTVSIGSTDLHSMGQLYLGGPKDKQTTFVYSSKSTNIKLPGDSNFKGLVDSIDGKEASEIMAAILDGVKIAYERKNLPFMEIILDNLSEYSLGEFLQFKMFEMMFLGDMLNVNTFDQPNIEDYKVETKKILSS